MITRERLEELISQRATIYSTDWDEAVELSPETCTVENIKISEYGEEIGEKLFVKEDEQHIPSYRLSALEEYIETEKFKKEFQNITREEILNLPTWEELNIIDEIKIYGGNGRRYLLQADEYDISIYADDGYDFMLYKQFDRTKENYLEACKMVKKLFLGDKMYD